mmetsp:Transcript_24978/g.82320  ORF Transcript_24978/g.82320 Transcript_24978/m.82320 type:complete len:423 (-) Transcript_24978:1254-2522(-)
MVQGEAERLVEEIRVFGIEEIGLKAWTKQHQVIEKLNMQAQISVMNQSDEYVVEALIDHEKISTLIHCLIVCEVWKDTVLVKVQQDLASSHYVKLYLIMYHEAVILGLLEKAFYHSSAVSMAGDSLIELSDYCYRKTVYLNSFHSDTEEESPKRDQILNMKDIERLEEQKKKIDFSCAISALTVLRFIVENAETVPISVLSRLLTEQDIMQTLIPLLDDAPWTRKKDKVIEKYEDGKWIEVSQDDLHRISKTEAQVWLTLNCLLLHPECRRKYEWTENRKSLVMKLSKYFNELLIDQLPILSEMRRLVETLAFSAPNSGTEPRSVVIEQIPELRDKIMRSDFKAIAAMFKSKMQNESPEDQKAEMSELAAMYDMLNVEDFMEVGPTCFFACNRDPVLFRTRNVLSVERLRRNVARSARWNGT